MAISYKQAIKEAKERAKQQPPPLTAKGNKYSAKRVQYQGIWFDSIHERNQYIILRDKQRRGEISDLQLQVPIWLEGRDGPLLTRTGQQMRLTVDFVYVDTASGETLYVDAKGKITRDYEVRKAVAEAMGYAIIEV